MSKSQRQHLLAKILEEQAVSSQAKLVELLKAEGIDVTQATLSRDLEELGAVKVRVPVGDSIYAVPDNPTERVLPVDYLRRVLGEWLVEVSVSNNIVVLRTPPGSAHVVASAVDRCIPADWFALGKLGNEKCIHLDCSFRCSLHHCATDEICNSGRNQGKP